MKIKKIAPWNWFKSEAEDDRKNRENLYKSDHGGRHPLIGLHREMDRVFEGFLPSSQWPEMPLKWWKLSDDEFSLLKPNVDISESKKEYKVKVEVPGVEKDDIHVDVQDQSLVIHGEKKEEQVGEDEHYHRMERYYGSFQRVLNLPPDADTSEVEARFKNGVLNLKIKRCPKKKVNSRTIEIT